MERFQFNLKNYSSGNYDEAKLLLEPSQPVDIADAIGSLPLILQALAFRLLKNEAIEVYEYLDPIVQQTLLDRLRSGRFWKLLKKCLLMIGFNF